MPRKRLNSCAALFVRSNNGKQCLLQRTARGLWFPYAFVSIGDSIQETAESVASQTGVQLSRPDPRILSLTVLRLKTRRFTTTVYETTPAPATTNEDSKQLLQWVDITDLEDNPELLDDLPFRVANQKPCSIFQDIHRPADLKKLLEDESLLNIIAPPNPEHDEERQRTTKLFKLDRLFHFFYSQATPALQWNVATLRKFHDDFDAERLLSAFSTTGRKYINFTEYLNGLCVISRVAPHEGDFALTRGMCAARYYQRNNGTIGQEEFLQLFDDLSEATRSFTSRAAKSGEELMNKAKDLKLIKDELIKEGNVGYTVGTLGEMIGNATFPDFAFLLRRKDLTPFMERVDEVYAKQRESHDRHSKRRGLMQGSGDVDDTDEMKIAFNVPCISTITNHGTMITENFAEIGKKMTDWPKVPEKELPAHMLMRPMRQSIIDLFAKENKYIGDEAAWRRPLERSLKSLRKSVMTFDQGSPALMLLTMIDEVTRRTGDTPATWYYEFKSTNQFDNFCALFLEVAEQTAKVCFEDSRLVRVSSPAYIVGDIHGNFAKLRQIHDLLWKHGPELCPSNLVFLGDYVDGGNNSFLVVAYLFACKLIRPDGVTLLRGNHEDRMVNTSGGLYEELLDLVDGGSGMEPGPKEKLTSIKIFDAINRVFDTLPLAATIDEKVFCAHSGIPSPHCFMKTGTVADIDQVEPSLQSIANNRTAVELLYNRGLTPHQLTDPCIRESLNRFKIGFTPNVTIEEGSDGAQLYTSTGLLDFLESNNLSLVVVASERRVGNRELKAQSKLLRVSLSCQTGWVDSKRAIDKQTATIAFVQNKTLQLLSLDLMTEMPKRKPLEGAAT